MTNVSLVPRTTRSFATAAPFPMLREVERLFGEDLFAPFRAMDGWFGQLVGEGRWFLAIDIREEDEAYLVVAELPGLTKDDVEVTVEDNRLTLQGERKWAADAEREKYHRIERTYGKFSRTFTLPHPVQADTVQAVFKDGVLHLTVPKAEEARPRKIRIT